MKKYRRFNHDAERRPLLFFVAVFVLGTMALGGTFLFFARAKNTTKMETPARVETATVDEPVLVAVNAAEYRGAMAAAFTAFRNAVTAAAGGWIDAPTWDARMRDTATLKALDRAAETLHTVLIETRVPGPARQGHLLMVVATEDLLDAVRSDRVEAVEGLLLRLQELTATLSS